VDLQNAESGSPASELRTDIIPLSWNCQYCPNNGNNGCDLFLKFEEANRAGRVRGSGMRSECRSYSS
jgi:hypothetical protein